MDDEREYKKISDGYGVALGEENRFGALTLIAWFGENRVDVPLDKFTLRELARRIYERVGTNE